MATLRTNNYVHNFQLSSGFYFSFLIYFLSVDIVSTVAVLSKFDNGNGKFGGLDENFVKNLRKSFIETRDGSKWNSSKISFQVPDRGSFQEPPVMDKPGLFFPDNINPWTPWSSCNGEVQTRTRGPVENAKLKKCGHIECIQTKSCQSSFGARSSQWSSWEAWSACNFESRIASTRTRVRQCRDQSVNSKQNSIPSTSSCPGAAFERVACENQYQQQESSEWMNWSQWSTCERGSQFRTRSCKGQGRCVGAGYEQQVCSSSTPFNIRNCKGINSNFDRTRRGPFRQTTWTK
uniref:Uncharacterized protein n=1 Tax=Arion vulgaris TaxID=1028688 RepID=A0A0B6ZTI8_9EUPU